MRFQELMPDVLHWLGITRIHRFASMSDMKCDALIRQGIAIDDRVPLPDDMIPPDARVEIEAKLAAGYFAGERPRGDYAGTVGRDLNE
jgi:GTP cyclohydrolase II